jgi:hypothetical protein
VVEKVALGQVSPSTSVSPVNLQSTTFSILTNIRGTYSRPVNDQRAEWTEFGLHPYYADLKRIILFRIFYFIYLEVSPLTFHDAVHLGSLTDVFLMQQFFVL